MFLFLSLGTALLFFQLTTKKQTINSIEKINVLLVRWATKTMTENQPCRGKALFLPFFSVGGGNIKSKSKKKHLFFYPFFLFYRTG
jgi:hypothetical protein